MFEAIQPLEAKINFMKNKRTERVEQTELSERVEQAKKRKMYSQRKEMMK